MSELTDWARGRSLLAPDPFPAAAEGVLLSHALDAELAKGEPVVRLFRASVDDFHPDLETDFLTG